MISDILEIANTFALGFPVTVDIEKAFNSVNQRFLLQILRKLGFGINFTSRINSFMTEVVII